MATAAGFLFPVAIAAYSLAMLKEGGWPEWLGLVIGVASLAVNVFGISLPLPNLFGYVSNGWYAVLAVLFMGKGRAAAPA
jgi:hypothetical protein